MLKLLRNFLLISIFSIYSVFAAGSLSTLSPCVLPLIPILPGSAMAENKLASVPLGFGLALSFASA